MLGEKTMKYTGKVYSPPFESESLLLQATVGCSHNKCTFCSMYQGVQFQTETIDLIKGITVETEFFGLHTSNVIPVHGMLPYDKERMFERLEMGLKRLPNAFLDSIPDKDAEGGVTI